MQNNGKEMHKKSVQSCFWEEYKRTERTERVGSGSLKRAESGINRLRIILAFHIALIYYTQDFRVYEGTRDQPMPGPFPAQPIS